MDAPASAEGACSPCTATPGLVSTVVAPCLPHPQAGHQMFVNLPTAVASSEAEEIGVEHLLRDVKDASVSTLAEDVMAKVAALRGLQGRLEVRNMR